MAALNVAEAREKVEKEGWYQEAFRGVEAPENFPTPRDLEAYRRGLIEKTRTQADFILRHARAPVRLLELGTGNGRIPISLTGRGCLAYAMGLDISETRIRFARQWSVDEGIRNVDFEVSDVLATPAIPRDFNLAICVSGTFGYFAAITAGSDLSVLEYVGEHLIDRGRLILEVYTHPLYRKRCLESPDGVFRCWDPLPSTDPFSFYLHEMTFDEERQVLAHHKIFIPRQGGKVDDWRWEYLKLYGEGELEGLIRQAGFEVSRVVNGLTAEGGNDAIYGTRLIIADRVGGRRCPS